MQDEVIALRALMALQEQMNDKFLKELIMHLALDVPSFDGQGFLDALHLVQETLPSPDKDAAIQGMSFQEIGLEIWRQKIELTERALANAEKVREVERSHKPPNH